MGSCRLEASRKGSRAALRRRFAYLRRYSSVPDGCNGDPYKKTAGFEQFFSRRQESGREFREGWLGDCRSAVFSVA